MSASPTIQLQQSQQPALSVEPGTGMPAPPTIKLQQSQQPALSGKPGTWMPAPPCRPLPVTAVANASQGIWHRDASAAGFSQDIWHWVASTHCRLFPATTAEMPRQHQLYIEMESFWSEEWGLAFFNEIMPRNRYREIMRHLCFDNKHNRCARLSSNKFALVSDVWGGFVANSITCYKPGANITVDEQLFPTKAQCRFTHLAKNLLKKHTSLVGTVNKIRRELPPSVQQQRGGLFSTKVLKHDQEMQLILPLAKELRADHMRAKTSLAVPIEPQKPQLAKRRQCKVNSHRKQNKNLIPCQGCK
eukprot:superscaffoldBa00001319_g10043